MNRRTFALSTAAATLAAPLVARAATTVTTQAQWIKNVEYAGYWIADADGMFAKEGLSSNVLSGGANLTSVEAIVAAGRADVGIDQFEKIVDANAQGEDFVVFGALYQRNPAALLSLPAKPVHRAHDILKKRLGLQQGGKLYLDAIMRVNHLPPDYTEVVVGFDPEPLLQGACDAYLCFVTNQPLMLAAKHIPYVTATFDTLGYATVTDALFCTRDYLTKNRSALVGYLRALRAGWAANATDPQRGAHLTTTVYGASLGLDEAQQVAINRAQIPLMESPATKRHGPLWVDPAYVAGPVYTSLRATGRTKLPPVDRILDVSLLRDAAKR
jgi:ABC-type nitrate/sulfonate/bicarbonate transport system substrate-binding protein